MKGSISSVNFASVTSQKALMPALSIIECHVEPHFFRFPVKVKKLLSDVPATLAWKLMSVMLGLAWSVDIKR